MEAPNVDQQPNSPAAGSPLENTVASDLTPDKPSSYKVLETEMLFWHQKGEQLYNFLIDFVKAHQNLHNRNNANLVTQITKLLADTKSKAVDAAAKLAPFQLPKLQAIDIQNKSTVRFVVAAPPLAKSNGEWLANVEAEKEIIDQAEANKLLLEHLSHDK